MADPGWGIWGKSPPWQIQGVAMVSAETPLKIACTPNLLTTYRVGDKITTSYTWCVIVGLLLGKKLHTFAFENHNYGVQEQVVTFFFGFRLTTWLKLSGT